MAMHVKLAHFLADRGTVPTAHAALRAGPAAHTMNQTP